MRVVSEKIQQEAAEKLSSSLEKMEGVESTVDIRTSGTQNRPIVTAIVSPENWRKVAEELKNKYSVDHCSMITGIHWPESSDKKWEVVYHFLRTGDMVITIHYKHFQGHEMQHQEGLDFTAVNG